jgi:hypothetical protein
LQQNHYKHDYCGRASRDSHSAVHQNFTFKLKLSKAFVDMAYIFGVV